MMNNVPTSWFFVWLPARNFERDKKSSSSKARCSGDFTNVRERSCSQGRRGSSPHERSCSAASFQESEESASVRPFRSSEERPVLQSLPAIQEDQDIFLPPTVPKKKLAPLKIESDNEGPSDVKSPDIGERASCNISTTSTASTAATSPSDSTGQGPIATATPDVDDTDSIKDQDKLAKQESYDSHVKRGADGTTPVTPITPNAFPGLGESAKEGSMDCSCSMSFVEWEPMEDICRKLLDKLAITPFNAQNSVDNKQVLITFCVPFDMVEYVLLELQNKGVGQADGSSVSVVPSPIHFTASKLPGVQTIKEQEEENMDRFYTSVKSRLLVAEVIARIQAGAEFSFDFLLLLLLASMIAFMGLMENSTVVLVASMLVSPLMGPILAGIFGGVVQDRSLTWKGIRYETFALFICIAFGFVLGLVVSPFPREYGCPQWPTAEMLSRGQLRSLWVGILIAVPSGAGVALSVLGGNAGSLVGVAISASLLPPAVNAGLFWALAFVTAVTGSDSSFFYGHNGGGMIAKNETLMILEADGTLNNVSGYPYSYYENVAMESFCLGLVSLTLTLVNILCIILTGVFILRLKEVTPEKIPQKFSTFWRKDIKAHRNYYKTLKSGDNQKLLNELQSLGISNAKANDGLAGTFLQGLFERAEQDTNLLDIKQWVPLGATTMPPSSTKKHFSLHEVCERKNDSFAIADRLNRTLKGPSFGASRSFRRDDNQQGYATVHSTSASANPTFLNMPQFFTAELSRSHDLVAWLYCTIEGEDGVQPTAV